MSLVDPVNDSANSIVKIFILDPILLLCISLFTLGILYYMGSVAY